MLLHRLPYIKNLTIKGLVNHQDLDQVFSNLVYLQNNIQLDQDIVFANQVVTYYFGTPQNNLILLLGPRRRKPNHERRNQPRKLHRILLQSGTDK